MFMFVWIGKLFMLPFKLLAMPFKRMNRGMDKIQGKTKCPVCRSADVRKDGRMWHCNSCGRNFK